MADKQVGPTVYTALIMPLSSHATFPKPQPPQQPGQPRPPTAGGQPPRPDHTLPGELPRPEHPIFLPLPPGILPPQIDNALPGAQPHPEHPIARPPGGGGQPQPPVAGTPPQPEHPIVLPPETEGGWGPIYIWGGGPGARPPIEVPPDGATEDGADIKFKAIWSPDNGWQTIGVIVPGEDGKPHPTPSAKK
jgi:hypothetical protein